MIRLFSFFVYALLAANSVAFAQNPSLALPEEYKLKPGTYPFNADELLSFDPYEVCKSPTQSPNCVAKTVWGCQFEGASSIVCGSVGFFISPNEVKKISINEVPPGYVPKEHWRMTWSRLGRLRSQYSLDIASLRPMMLRPVSIERFKADSPLKPELIGTHEIIIYAGEDWYGGERKIGMSVFVKQTHDGWQATSFSVNGYQQGWMIDNSSRALPPSFAGSTESYYEECEDYGCGMSDFFDDKARPRRSAQECIGKMCAYRALGIQKPIIPMPEGKSASMRPIYLPGLALECGWGDPHPMCRW